MRNTLVRLIGAGCFFWLAGCTSAPPAPGWQMNAHDAAARAVQAYLGGDDRVAQAEFKRAREQVSRTGRPDLMARLALTQCAAEVASLSWNDCPAFEALRGDASGAERAYADYLAGRLASRDVALLPEAQRAVAADITALGAIADPLSRLVAAGAALRAGRATAPTLLIASDTASQQGWRRPLLAWLLLREHRAREAGDQAQAQALQRRIDIVQGSAR